MEESGFKRTLVEAYEVGAMKDNETPLTLHYWDVVGGTICFEYPVVKFGPNNERRYIDAVIIPSGIKKMVRSEDIDIEGQK